MNLFQLQPSPSAPHHIHSPQPGNSSAVLYFNPVPPNDVPSGLYITPPPHSHPPFAALKHPDPTHFFPRNDAAEGVGFPSPHVRYILPHSNPNPSAGGFDMFYPVPISQDGNGAGRPLVYVPPPRKECVLLLNPPDASLLHGGRLVLLTETPTGAMDAPRFNAPQTGGAFPTGKRRAGKPHHGGGTSGNGGMGMESPNTRNGRGGGLMHKGGNAPHTEEERPGGLPYSADPTPIDVSKTQLIVNYLPQALTDVEFRHLFAKYGLIHTKPTKIIYDQSTGRRKGYGFVYYKDGRSTEMAIKEMNGYEMCGRRLKVRYADQQRTSVDCDSCKGAEDDQTETADEDVIFPTVDSIPEFMSASSLVS